MTTPPDPNLALAIDRTLPLSVGVQLRGQIEYGVSTGEIPRGTRLPSVRDLARTLRMSPATVSQVYRELGEQGLLESYRGLGTFVPRRLPPSQEPENAVALRRAIDTLFATAERLGFARAAVAEAVTLRAGQADAGTTALRLLFVGIYPEASRAYAAALRGALRAGDVIEWTTFGQFRERGSQARVHDVYLTVANRERDLRDLLPAEATVVSLTFIPSRETRTRLAQLPADARVTAVTNVPEFLPTLQRNVVRFAPHVDAVEGLLLSDPELEHALRDRTTVIYGTGTSAVLAHVPPDVDAFEFRFEPETHAVTTLLLPTLEGVRGRRAPKETP